MDTRKQMGQFKVTLIELRANVLVWEGRHN